MRAIPSKAEICKHVTYNGKQFDKIHIIQNVDHDAGFSALITYALNGIRKALENNWLPVVYYDKTTPFFYDPNYGENVWEYYYYPVAGISHAQVRQWLREGKITENDLHSYPKEDMLKWHLEDPARIAPFWAWEKPAAWMSKKRALGRKYVTDYVKVKANILEKVDEFYAKHLQKKYVIGVHIRGTDFAYAKPTSPFKYFEAIHSHLYIHNKKDFNIFLATDQIQFVELFQREFKDRLVRYDAFRSGNHMAPHNLNAISGYKKGEEVLIDILILSRCNFLFKAASAVGEYALWFNPSLDCHDFALSSEFLSGRYSLRKSAYFRLDAGNYGPIRLKLLSGYQILKQILREGKRILDSKEPKR